MTDKPWEVIHGNSLDVLKTLPDESVNCCVTSPPYYALRDYGYDWQIGLEETPEQYIQKLVEVFHEVKRVLKDDGTLWINIGDSYAAQRSGTHQPAETLAGGQHGYTDDGKKVNRGRKDGYNPARNAAAIGLKHKDLIGIPWMLAFALRADGWYLRQDIIWSKPNPMPESVKDRCTKSHEYIFLLSKKPNYYFDYESIQEEANVQCDKSNIKFGGNKYGNLDDNHFLLYSGNNYNPKHKNLQYNGQKNNTMHERRAEGLPDIVYTVRNKRDVWVINVGGGYKDEDNSHYATFSTKLIEPCIRAGSPLGGVILDPFSGTGTTGAASLQLARKYIGIDLSEKYVEMSRKRLQRISDQSNLFDLM